MKHIEKITITNARRFGENVEIDFGAGATIILAPNGTGKTTIFEAIELALTGRVKRIEKHPDVIIRNGLSEMNARLEFSENKYCQVNYVKGEDCTSIGDHKELFRNENDKSLPYLFRLTHFLEQRGKEWFVEQGDSDAGDFLSHLPLGKDLHHMLSKRTSLLTAFGKIRKVAEKALNDVEKEFSAFEELVAKRDSLATEITLTPLKELVAKLLPISKLIGYTGYDETLNLSAINAYFEIIRTSIKQENIAKKDFVIKLNSLKERVNLYISNIELLNQKQLVISELTKKIDEIEPVVIKDSKGIQDAKASLVIIKNEILKLKSDISMFEKIEQKKENIGVKRAELEHNEKALVELNKSYEATVTCLKENERLRDQHKLANEAIKCKKNALSQIKQKRENQKEWQEILKTNQKLIENKIPEIEKRRRESLEVKLCLDNKVSEADKVYLIKSNALESLNKASGAIQDAVSNIRKHLTEDQRNCPVCLANYEPGDLIKRIEGALNTLNPSIPLAIKEEKSALEVLKLVKEQQRNENQKLSDVESELKAAHDKLKVNRKIILEKFILQFPECKTPEEANNYINEQIAQITSQISQLEISRNQLGPEVAIEKIDNAKLEKSENERLLNELVAKNQNTRKDITKITADVDIANNSLKDSRKNFF